MDAHKAIISNIFNGSTYVDIPFFQRSYVWDEDLWERLLQDMEFVCKTKKPHFLGSIILKEGKQPDPSEHVTSILTVVDGQQRLTTFLIFLKVLCLKKGEMTLFDFQFRIMNDKIALRHGKNDIIAFNAIMDANKAVAITNFPVESKIINAFNYFVEKIDETKLDVMTIEMNTQFVRIDLNVDEDEQQIFDTINSLGVSLTTSELLKNYFFSRETVDEYEDKWVSVFECDNDTKKYWDREFETGRVKRAMIDIFFDAYFQIFIQDKKYPITAEDKLDYARLDNLAQSYQHFITNYCGGDKNVILNPMRRYAENFKATFDPEECNRSIPREYGLERLNIIIFGLKTTTLIPYVLYISENVNDNDELIKMCGILESYIMRRMVTHAPTKNYNRLFTSLILNRVLDSGTLATRLQKSVDATTYIPKDDDLKHGFENSRLTNLQTKGILYLLESLLRPYNSSTSLLGFNNYSLEHLMPKKWRNNWTALPTEEENRERDYKLLTLGNLAIITQSLNASIRDADWVTKKAGKGQNKPGLALCAAGLVTLHDALQKNMWNESEIDTRADWLYLQACNVWKI